MPGPGLHHFVLSGLMLVLIGCSSEYDESPARPSGTPEASHEDVTRNPDTQSHSSATTTTSDGTRGTTKETVRLWSGEINMQSGKLAEILQNGNAEASELPATLGTQIEMSDLADWQTKEIFSDPSIRVFEISPAGTTGSSAVVSVGAGAFVSQLSEAFHFTPSTQNKAVHFKLYGIVRDGERLKTKQRLTASGTQDGRRTRSHAVVNATWAIPKEEGTPGLLSFSMPKLRRMELTKKTPAPFEDVAERVLGANPAWEEQLQLGMNTWVQRMERSLKPDFFGYHGLALGDVDGDDLEDLYLCQPGGLPNLLFKQQPDGSMTDISAAAGVDWLDNSTGALLIDLDNDGDADLTTTTQTALLVMENDGTGKFTLRKRISEAGLGYSPTAADYDSDGDLDLLVLRYSADSREIGGFPTPHPFHSARNGGANVLLENRGDFRLVNVTQERGLDVENYRFSFAASWEDYDNDSDLDLYLVNDFGPNQLFRNDGRHFVDVSVQSHTQDWGFGMSATWADYDRDGHMDLYVSSMFSGAGNQIVPQTDFNPTMNQDTRRKYLKMVRGNTLMRNTGDGRFADVTNPAVEGFAGWAWGSKFADLNNDGWEDLYVANGYLSQPDREDL